MFGLLTLLSGILVLLCMASCRQQGSSGPAEGDRAPCLAGGRLCQVQKHSCPKTDNLIQKSIHCPLVALHCTTDSKNGKQSSHSLILSHSPPCFGTAFTLVLL